MNTTKEVLVYKAKNYWCVRIKVITADCLSAYGSSILPRIAKIVVRQGNGEWALVERTDSMERYLTGHIFNKAA